MVSGKALAIGIAAICVIPQIDTGGSYRLNVPIQFVAIDALAGGTDATTTAVKIYDANYELLETVTISTAAGTDSAIKYWSGDYVYLKVYDDTDTSLCTQYLKLMVPYHSADTDTKHYVTLKTVDTDASWDIRLDCTNETNVADSGTWDTSSSGTAPTWVFKVLTPTDDKGYLTSWNFVEGCDNAAYYVFRISGTGATRVLFDTNYALNHYYDGEYHWYSIRLSDDQLTKNLLADGTYEPIGYTTIPLKMDLTQVTSGDSVTFDHGLYYYSDWNYLIEKGNWGPDSTTVTESITIQP
ncbi:MAG: hypothetical protein ACTSSE_18215 [Candidatus Thorarchaeota archaeon]